MKLLILTIWALGAIASTEILVAAIREANRRPPQP